MSVTRQHVVEYFKGMSVSEARELISDIESAVGVARERPAPAIEKEIERPAPQPQATRAGFKVVLQEAGRNRIEVIRATRHITALGIRQAQELVDSAPKALKEGISKEEAEAIRERLAKIGARVAVEGAAAEEDARAAGR